MNADWSPSRRPANATLAGTARRLPYPDHDRIHQRIHTLHARVSQASREHAQTGKELDWWDYHQDLADLLAAVGEHWREHLRYLLEAEPGSLPSGEGPEGRSSQAPCLRAPPETSAKLT